jgi:cytochrome c-type protein NapC
MDSIVSLLRNRVILSLLSLAGLGIGVAASWALMDTMIHATGDDAFCSSCHSHVPIGASYRESPHGGNNATGWRASCSQCHIPHDNSLHYLWVKGVHGVVDPTMELLKDSYDIDWHGNRERREEYEVTAAFSWNPGQSTAKGRLRLRFQPVDATHYYH